MRIAILDLSYWPPEYMSGQPRFGEVIAVWAKRGLPETEFPVFDVVEGEAFPALENFDGFIISGSDKGVYDQASWMQELRDFLELARQIKKPLFGICFGHQIMADVFGGKAEKVSRPEVGFRKFKMDGKEVEGHVWHQDQVTEVPPGADVIASADYCPVAALAYDFPALSVQFHPEYPADYVMNFLKRSRGHILSETQTDKSVEELSQSPVSEDLFAEELGEFFRRHLV